MDLSCLSSDPFRLDEMAKHYGVDVCCVSWQTTDDVWTRTTNTQSLVSEEQMKSSKLHKVLLRRSAPLFYEDTTKNTDVSGDPLVAKFPNFRFYAEAPLVDECGNIFGSISLAHREPRSCREIKFPALEWMNEVRNMAIRWSLDASSAHPQLAMRSFTAISDRSTEGSAYPQIAHRTLTIGSSACMSSNSAENV